MTVWVWACQECGKRFRSARAAERAWLGGCPKCGGVDIDFVRAGVDEEREPERVNAYTVSLRAYEFDGLEEVGYGQ